MLLGSLDGEEDRLGCIKYLRLHIAVKKLRIFLSIGRTFSQCIRYLPNMTCTEMFVSVAFTRKIVKSKILGTSNRETDVWFHCFQCKSSEI